MSRNLAENVDLPAIFRTIDQGVVPGLTLTSPSTGDVLICSGESLIITKDTIVVTFAPIRLFDAVVSCSLDRSYPGSNAAAIPNSEWWLTVTVEYRT